jgi:hypothetical protein
MTRLGVHVMYGRGTTVSSPTSDRYPWSVCDFIHVDIFVLCCTNVTVVIGTVYFYFQQQTPRLKSVGHTRQDNLQSVAPPACADASITRSALDEPVELSVHAGDALEYEMCVLEVQER